MPFFEELAERCNGRGNWGSALQTSRTAIKSVFRFYSNKRFKPQLRLELSCLDALEWRLTPGYLLSRDELEDINRRGTESLPRRLSGMIHSMDPGLPDLPGGGEDPADPMIAELDTSRLSSRATSTGRVGEASGSSARTTQRLPFGSLSRGPGRGNGGGGGGPAGQCQDLDLNPLLESDPYAMME